MLSSPVDPSKGPQEHATKKPRTKASPMRKKDSRYPTHAKTPPILSKPGKSTRNLTEQQTSPSLPSHHANFIMIFLIPNRMQNPSDPNSHPRKTSMTAEPNCKSISHIVSSPFHRSHFLTSQSPSPSSPKTDSASHPSPDPKPPPPYSPPSYFPTATPSPPSSHLPLHLPSLPPPP